MKSNSKVPASLAKLIDFRKKIGDDAPVEIRSSLIDLLLSSSELPPPQRSSLLYDKVQIFADVARKAVTTNPELRPEIVFRDVDALVDELLKTGEPAYRHNILFAKMEALQHMQAYLKKMKTGQEKYATEITDRFLEICKQAPETFQDSSRMFSMFFLGDLEDIDAEHSTRLAKTFVERVIPAFAASKSLEIQQEARRLENVLRRLSLIGTEMEFETILLDGSKVDVKELRGKIVLVNFWSTTCGPCVREFPHMKTLYEKYKPQGYEMIAYGCDDDVEKLRAFAEKTKYPWPVGSSVLSKEKGLKDYHQYYGITGVPTTLILDRSGKVRFMMVGSDDAILTRELDKRFTEEPAPPNSF